MTRRTNPLPGLTRLDGAALPGLVAAVIESAPVATYLKSEVLTAGSGNWTPAGTPTGAYTAYLFGPGGNGAAANPGVATAAGGGSGALSIVTGSDLSHVAYAYVVGTTGTATTMFGASAGSGGNASGNTAGTGGTASGGTININGSSGGTGTVTGAGVVGVGNAGTAGTNSTSNGGLGGWAISETGLGAVLPGGGGAGAPSPSGGGPQGGAGGSGSAAIANTTDGSFVEVGQAGSFPGGGGGAASATNTTGATAGLGANGYIAIYYVSTTS